MKPAMQRNMLYTYRLDTKMFDGKFEKRFCLDVKHIDIKIVLP